MLISFYVFIFDMFSMKIAHVLMTLKLIEKLHDDLNCISFLPIWMKQKFHRKIPKKLFFFREIVSVCVRVLFVLKDVNFKVLIFFTKHLIVPTHSNNSHCFKIRKNQQTLKKRFSLHTFEVKKYGFFKFPFFIYMYFLPTVTILLFGIAPENHCQFCSKSGLKKSRLTLLNSIIL